MLSFDAALSPPPDVSHLVSFHAFLHDFIFYVVILPLFGSSLLNLISKLLITLPLTSAHLDYLIEDIQYLKTLERLLALAESN